MYLIKGINVLIGTHFVLVRVKHIRTLECLAMLNFVIYQPK